MKGIFLLNFVDTGQVIYEMALSGERKTNDGNSCEKSIPREQLNPKTFYVFDQTKINNENCRLGFIDSVHETVLNCIGHWSRRTRKKYNNTEMKSGRLYTAAKQHLTPAVVNIKNLVKSRSLDKGLHCHYETWWAKKNKEQETHNKICNAVY